MKLCIPTLDEGRLKGRLSSHFGSAPFFTMIDSQTGNVEVIENRHSSHEHGSCEPSEELVGHLVDAVICPGLGRRAFGRLTDAGIAVFVTDDEDVSAAVEAFRAGALARLTSEQACHGGRRHAHPE